MQKKSNLDTFVIAQGGTIISPALVTTRQYGVWFRKTFDKFVAAKEVFMASKEYGEATLESHPGTKIGYYFDTHMMLRPDLQCWYIPGDSAIMEKLIKLGLAELNDCYMYKGQQMLRVYTVSQVALYIKTKVDKNFDISPYLLEPKQIVATDISKLIMPQKERSKKALF